MICPNCGCHDSAGVTRTITQYSSVKRYRKCIACGTSYATKETPDLEENTPKKKTNSSKSDKKSNSTVETKS